MRAVAGAVPVVLMSVALVAGLGATATKEPAPGFGPGVRVMLDAHNAYPEQGRGHDRVARALSTGLPVAIEQDLVWLADERGGGRSIVSHGEPVTGDEPTLADFLQSLRPTIDAAMAAPDRSRWPLVVVNLDFKDSVPAHFRAIASLLATYDAWLTTAERLEDPSVVAPLRVGPVLVLTGEDPAQAVVFHDEVPVGGRVRLFGGYHPPRQAPADGDAAGWLAAAHRVPPATNYRRWLNNPWRVVEVEGQAGAGGWTPEEEGRLRALVSRAHEQGLWIRFYTLNGHPPGDGAREGWSAGYNIGSLAAVQVRWRAAIAAGVDFIATDQYEALAAELRAPNGV